MTTARQRRRAARREGAGVELALLAARARARRRRGRRQPLLLVGLAMLVSLVAAAVAFVGAGGADTLLAADCSLRAMRPISLGENSFVFAADGARLGSIPSAANREPLPLRAISPWLVEATVAIEDRRFYQHGGLDYEAIVRAALADLASGRIVEGGSTLEQELARNLYLGNDRKTFARKLEEACLATKIAGRWSKRRILDAYLNQVGYGNRAFGAAAAARTYFARPARALTVGEAALLAGLPQAPSLDDPFLHPRLALERRNEVLRALLASRAISAAAYRYWARRPLGLHHGSAFTRLLHPGFVAYVERRLVAHLGSRLVKRGGLRITTTLQPRLQDAARAAIRTVLVHAGDPAAALVAIDPASGAIRAMTAFQPGRMRLAFNLAADGRRQAGSAFKPFVLATALERGFSLGSAFDGPSSYLVTDPRCDTGTQPWLVHNYAGESLGTISLLTATADSVNTVYAQLVDQLGPQAVVQTAHRMGITSPLQPVCSIALGTQPVSPLEMADAYATLAADGIHHPPHAVASVRAPDGTMLHRPDRGSRRALPADIATTVTQALQAVVAYGTGTAAALGTPAAGKTGTAEHEQDAWFCGYLPQLASCVWVGYPAGEIPMHNLEGIPAVVGGTLPAEIWHEFMTAAVAPAAADRAAITARP